LLPDKEIQIQNNDIIKLGVHIEKFHNHPTELLVTLLDPFTKPAIGALQSLGARRLPIPPPLPPPPFPPTRVSRISRIPPPTPPYNFENKSTSNSFHAPDTDSENEVEEPASVRTWIPFARRYATPPPPLEPQDDSSNALENDEEVNRQLKEGLISLLQGIVSPTSANEAQEDEEIEEDIESEVEDAQGDVVEEDPFHIDEEDIHVILPLYRY